jgi:pilus assembly protein CpaF
MSADKLGDLNLFDESSNGPSDMGALRMLEILRDPAVMQITANKFNRIFYTDSTGVHLVDRVFAGPEHYTRWVNSLLPLTDVGYTDVETALTSVIEGSFDARKTDIHGSIHISTREITRGEPALTVRKQPREVVTLDRMVEQGMMSVDMRIFIEQAVRGRLNILLSGGSGAGKTTMARAMSMFIDPNQRVITVEEIDELHLDDRLPNVVSLTTSHKRDEQGRTIRRTSLDDLVRESLRMRADRVWVGETRGKEAYALVKACNSGHDGSVTTMHADNGAQAVRQVVTYVMESGLTEEVARDQVAQAFHIVLQISKVAMGRRVISEIVELESVREGNEQRRNPLYQYDPFTGTFHNVGRPTPALRHALQRYGVNWDDVQGRM